MTPFLVYNVFDAISFNIDNILSTNPSANVLACQDFSVYHKDWPI